MSHDITKKQNLKINLPQSKKKFHNALQRFGFTVDLGLLETQQVFRSCISVEVLLGLCYVVVRVGV